MLKASCNPVSARQTARPSSSRGATLLEVLIAVVVLAIGLLGFAALQSTSLQSGHSSYQRSQATWLAYDMLDRMRANPDNLAEYAFALPATPPVCIPNLTASGSGAARDRTEWLNAIACQLRPNGNGNVEVSNTTVVVNVRWVDARANLRDEDPAEVEFSLSTEF